ncbi:MAG TPA: aminotransferase class III-fold pyridoxal phosphate-dependent enzyme, partial [Phycisphaerae bacterium]|nr:aminotransferase class III-fold pyridoxal phosphate-dependent enzyme [Phycisphaerae bacterium]
MAKKTTPAQTWAHVDLKQVPSVPCPPPGPKSNALHARCTRHFKGLSGQVKLFPVVFESGQGCILTDVDGNRYIDFSSGIYVTTLGHCHP